MKITIDTKEDSFEDIKKVLNILTSILERKDLSAPPVDTTDLMTMFSNSDQPKEDKAPDFSSFLNLANKKEEKKDIPKIEFF